MQLMNNVIAYSPTTLADAFGLVAQTTREGGRRVYEKVNAWSKRHPLLFVIGTAEAEIDARFAAKNEETRNRPAILEDPRTVLPPGNHCHLYTYSRSASGRIRYGGFDRKVEITTAGMLKMDW